MQNYSQPNQKILVIAANGKTGHRVVALLEESGATVRRGSRSGSPAFDWERPGTWATALGGMDAAYVVYTPDLAVPSAAADLLRFVEVAKQQGLKKLVLLSGRGEPEARACERIVESSGLAWTIVRAGWFSQNFSEGDFSSMVVDGVIALPNPEALEPFVDVDDIAEVAAAALTDSRHDGKVYEVTGPELLTYHQVAAQLSEATGRNIRYQPITANDFFSGMKHAGVPESYRELLHYLFDITQSGVNAHVTHGIERALGRPPKTFREFAAQTAANGGFKAAKQEVTRG